MNQLFEACTRSSEGSMDTPSPTPCEERTMPTMPSAVCGAPHAVKHVITDSTA